MKNLTALCFILIITFSACHSTRTTATVSNQSATPATIEDTNKDGSTIQNAVVVKSIDAEYQWVQQKYPGARVLKQALIFEKKKPYDLLTFRTSSGEQKEAYFDISSFYGKF